MFPEASRDPLGLRNEALSENFAREPELVTAVIVSKQGVELERMRTVKLILLFSDSFLYYIFR